MGEDTTVTAAAQIAQTAVSALRDEADYHKRLSRQHKSAAGAALRRAQNIIDNCTRLGIEVEITVRSQPATRGTE